MNAQGRAAERLEDESGASLMLVIIFVMIFSVIIAAILDFASTSFKTSNAVAEVRVDQQAVDGAVDGAINAIRGSSSTGVNDPTKPCPDFHYTPPGGTTDPSVTVHCSATGIASDSANDNIPEYAILALGTAASEGFIKTGNSPLTVDGGVFSNSKIDIQKDNMTVFGDAFAKLGCPPESGGVPTALFASGQTACHTTLTEADPNYPAAASSVAGMATDPAATCSSSNSVVRFVPGVYTRLPKFAVPAGCNGAVWWFSPGASAASPGVYYFDFPDAESLWDMHDAKVAIVGGTPKGWSASTNAGTVAALFGTAGGVCDPGTEGAPNPGVQFIFGGQTRWTQQVNGEGIELCASGGATGQRIAFYGLKTGARTVTSNEVKQATTATGTNFTPNPPNAALAVDGNLVTSALAADNNKSASLTVSSFADIPDGSRIDAATIEITHSETASNPGHTPNLTWKWKPQTGADVTCAITTNNALHTDVCDLMPALGTQSPYPYRPFNGMQSSTLDVDGNSLVVIPGDDCLKNNGDPKPNCTPTPATNETAAVNVDGIILKVTYSPPAFEAHRCATSTTPPSCAILETKTNPNIYFRGTFYAPTARVTVNIHNKGDTVFQRGIIARMIDGDVSASSKQTDAPFQLPGVVQTRVVLFTAEVGGNVRLRAKVKYTDTDNNGTILPGTQVKILSWVVVR